MIFKELLTYCKAKAIADFLSPTEESIWREACRTYSTAFHTPLAEAMKLDPEHVLLSNFERELEDVNMEENVDRLLEQIYRIENPNYDEEQEQDLQDYIKKLEDEEKRNPPKKKLSKKKVEVPKDQPKSGSVDFSGLKNEG